MDVFLGVSTILLGLGVCIILLVSAFRACSNRCYGNCNQGRTQCNCREYKNKNKI